jgi:hypothetical protein
VPQPSNNCPTNAVSEKPLIEEEAIATLTNLIRSEIQKLSISICKFLKEIILTDFSKENKKGKELLTISATRKHFGSGVAEALLRELHDETTITEEPASTEATFTAACTSTCPGPSSMAIDEVPISSQKRQTKTARNSKKKKT